MSRTVDERVVEMRFDNKQFEHGAKETMSTLDKLKEALKFSKSEDAIDALGKSVKDVDLSGIAKGVQMLEDRFSTMGIVGMRVIQNLTDSLMGFVSKGVNFVTDSIISGGLKRATNVENARFQLQSLIKDEMKVNEILDQAKDSVDGTAYSFDVAAKAASMFTASGVQSGDQMKRALAAMADTTAAVNGDYESMSMIFTQVAGQGRLMGDQLLQLSTRGMNAAATIATYFREVRGEANTTEADIREMVSKGKIDFQTFVDALEYTYSDSAKKANATFNGAYSNVKAALARIGEGFFAPLIAQNSEIVRLLNAFRVRINDVKKALVFDETIGNVNALSKQFTDSVLHMASGVADFLENADLTKPMQAFYYSFESVKNVIKGVISVLSPLGRAFKEVFLSFTGDDVVGFTKRLEALTAKLKLSDEGAENLHDAFKGVFDIIKLLGQGFIKLVSAIVPINKPITSLSGGLLELLGAAGRGLSAFSEWVRQSPIIAGAYHAIADGINYVMTGLGTFIGNIKDYALALYNLEGTQKIIKAISDAFDKLGTVAAPYVDAFIKKATELKDNLGEIIPKKTNDAIDWFVKKINDLGDAVENIDLSNPSEMFKKFGDSIKGMVDAIGENKGISGFVENVKNFVNNLKEAFTFDKLFDNIDTFRTKIDEFIKWIDEKVAPAFSDVSFGGLLGAGGLFFFLKELTKVVKAFNGNGGGIFGSFKEVLGSVKNTLVAYQKDLKADQIKKIATAILILSGALVLLSFADMEQLVPAAGILTGVAVALGFAFSAFSKMLGQWHSTESALNTFSKGLSSTMKKLGRAVEIRAIGKSVKDFATAILEIAVAIIAIALMYEKHPDGMDKAVKLVAGIAGGLIIMIAAMSALGKKLDGGMSEFRKAAAGALMLSASVLIVIMALEKLFEITLPSDYTTKLGILAGIFLGMGLLTVAVGAAARISGGNSTKQATTILALTAMLYVTVKSVEKLFALELPSDYDVKLGILAGIFVALAGVVIAVGVANKLAGGALKAATSILAMCAFLVVAVGSLMVLSLIPGDKLLKGAVALGGVLIALGVALAGAGKITTKDTWKSVLAMTLAVGVITASLSVLSMIPWQKLLVAAASLGAVLLAMSVTLKYAAKNVKVESIGAIVAMIGMVAVIGYTLYELAEQPWQNILAAGISITAVIYMLKEILKSISKSTGLKKEKINQFLKAVLAIVPIGLALYFLSKQPWEGMLASAVALSGTILAFTYALKLVSGMKGIKPEKINQFLKASLAVIPIGLALYFLAGQPWEGMLASAVALSATLLALAGALAIASTVKPDTKALIGLGAATVAMGAVAFALYKLSELDSEKLLVSAVALGSLLLELAVVTGICTLIGKLGPEAAIVGILALVALIVAIGVVMAALGALNMIPGFSGIMEDGGKILVLIGEALGGFAGAIISGLGGGIASAIEKIGASLSSFAENAKPFFNELKNMGNPETLAAAGILAAVILALTVAELINGVASFITGGDGMAKMGQQLSDFAAAAEPFFTAVLKLTPESAQAAKTLSEMILLMTAAELVSGVAGFVSNLIGGGKSMADFGKELADFAGPIVEYAEKVQNVDFSGVEGSANAAKILMGLYDGLPKQGGWMQAVMGETMTLTDFAEELQKFGPAMVEYAQTIEGVDFSGVEGSANAAKIMMDLYSGLPKTGGWMQVIMGEQKTLSEFGQELALFGPLLGLYCVSIKGITGDSVKASADAAQILIDLSNNLGTNNTLWENIFGGGQKSLSEFGQELISFGTSLAGYSAQISLINTEQMHNVYTELTNLVQFTQAVGNGDTTGIQTFVSGLNAAGMEGVNQFIAAFTNSYATVTTTVETFVGKATSAMQLKTTVFTEKGQAAAVAYTTAIKNQYVEATTTGQTLALKVVAGIAQTLTSFFEKGGASGTQYLSGMRGKYPEAVSTGHTLGTNALSGLQQLYSSFYTVGANGGQGFVDGLKSKMDAASSAGAAIGKAAYDAAKKALDEHSPSKKMGEVGENAGIGFVKRLLMYVAVAAKAGEELGEAVVDNVGNSVEKVNSLIPDEFDFNPVITPTMDLTEVRKSAAEINKLFNQAIGFTTDMAGGIARTVVRKETPSNDEANGKSGTTVVNNEFTQNNYSPKALNRTEIYRQTNNQFSRFTEAVKV